MIMVEEYHITINAAPGEADNVADGLSRINAEEAIKKFALDALGEALRERCSGEFEVVVSK